MEVIESGHSYNLKNYKEGYQQLIFVKKILIDEETLVVNGTKNEEVILALIDRYKSQNKKKFYKETKEIIILLESILKLIDKRKSNLEASRLKKKNNGLNQS